MSDDDKIVEFPGAFRKETPDATPKELIPLDDKGLPTPEVIKLLVESGHFGGKEEAIAAMEGIREEGMSYGIVARALEIAVERLFDIDADLAQSIGELKQGSLEFLRDKIPSAKEITRPYGRNALGLRNRLHGFLNLVEKALSGDIGVWQVDNRRALGIELLEGRDFQPHTQFSMAVMGLSAIIANHTGESDEIEDGTLILEGEQADLLKQIAEAAETANAAQC